MVYPLFVSLLTAENRIHQLPLAAEDAPINQAVIDGQNVTFRCGSEVKRFPHIWKYRDVAGEEITLAYGQNITAYKRRISIIYNKRGEYDLLISRAGRPEAGTYSCIRMWNVRNHTQSRRYEAQLVIIGKCEYLSLHYSVGLHCVCFNFYARTWYLN